MTAPRWTEAEMLHLAARGAVKVDLLGIRGATLVTCEELAAMAAVILLGVAVPADALTPKALQKGPTDV